MNNVLNDLVLQENFLKDSKQKLSEDLAQEIIIYEMHYDEKFIEKNFDSYDDGVEFFSQMIQKNETLLRRYYENSHSENASEIDEMFNSDIRHMFDVYEFYSEKNSSNFIN